VEFIPAVLCNKGFTAAKSLAVMLIKGEAERIAKIALKSK
jgi:hypothetical protein